MNVLADCKSSHAAARRGVISLAVEPSLAPLGHGSQQCTRRMLPEWSGDLDGLYDYARPPPPRLSRRGRALVTDGWPDFVPITEGEPRVIEAHFADALDELFGPLP